MGVLFGLLRVPRVLSPWWWLKRMVMLLAALYLAATFYEVWSAARSDDRSPSQAIVVMGAAQYNGVPSPVLKARLDHALALYRADVAPLVIVTGGRKEGDRVTEASASAQYLIRRGVPDARILREVKGRDSYESLRASARFLRERGVDKVVLVTDGYHAARVRATAREVGLEPTSSPVPGDAPMDRLLSETGAVAIGRIIGFRRLAQLTN